MLITGIGIGCGLGRADTVTTATAPAQIGINRYRITCRRDCAGRTHIQTPGTARNLAAGMGTQVTAKVDVSWLFKFPDQIGCGKDRLLHRNRIFGVGAQIAIPPFMVGKQGRTTRQIQNDITFRRSTIAVQTK